MQRIAHFGRTYLAAIRQTWKSFFLGGLLVAPVAMYIRFFGFEISPRHSVWAEMGSAMSGIYGPILSVLTLYLLITQVRLQAQTARLEHATTMHMYDQSYIQDARVDIEFYLARLSELLNAETNRSAVLREALLSRFAKAPVELLQTESVKANAAMIDRDYPQLQASWRAFNTILKGLEAEVRLPYELQLTSAQQKAIAVLSYPVCAALDNYLHCRTGGGLNYPYMFRTTLSPQSS